MTEESLEERLEIAEGRLKAVDDIITQWCEHLELEPKLDSATVIRLRYLLRRIEQYTSAQIAINLKDTDEQSAKRISQLENQLSDAHMKFNVIKQKHHQIIECLRLWIEACGDGLTHREKNERIRKAIVQTIEVELPTYMESSNF